MAEKPTYEELGKRILELEQAEEALRESEAQFRTLFESSPIGIGVADQQGNLLLFNDAILKPGGYSATDIQEIGNVAALYHNPEQREEALKRFREQGFLKDFQAQFKRKDGSHYDALCSLTPIHLKGQPCIQAVVEDITERKRAEEALIESEERFRITAEVTGQLLYSFDPKTGKVKWAGAVETITGYTYEEYQSFDVDAWGEQIHPDDREMVLKTMDEALEHHTSFYSEYRLRRKDGSYIFVEEHGAFVSDRESAPYPTVGTIIDITERKRAEEELRKSEEKYKTIIENIEDGYYEVDIAGSFIFFNDAMCKILGYSKDELSGMNNRQYMDEENAKEVFKTFNQVYKTGEPYNPHSGKVLLKTQQQLNRRGFEFSGQNV